MNKSAGFLISVIILLTFSFCSASKNTFQKSPPFKVMKVTYNSWVGGQPGVRGITIHITIDNPKINLDTVFFRKMKMKLKKDFSATANTFVGSFTLHNKEHDFILDKNSTKEFGNTPPKTSLNIPFKLKNNEAVVSYIYNDKTYFYKVNNIIEVKVVQYPIQKNQ
ncbi:hypothetical protein [Lutibacter sp.]|uniref:hypothetical protein n=1 Tax=Lutibacter sp. TaxID=1925666 RepID=UPI0025BCFB89|nr:hypothetical protein [Lutibacter sp.]MCF6168081.1 hypothetical protein [Lutibacter sp.]